MDEHPLDSLLRHCDKYAEQQAQRVKSLEAGCRCGDRYALRRIEAERKAAARWSMWAVELRRLLKKPT